MAEVQLVAALQATLDPNRETRRAAEAHLNTSASRAGYLPLLLTLITSNDPSVSGIKHIAVVHLKNVIKNNWVESDTPVPEVDRPTLKTNLVDLMSVAPTNIKAQLATSITLISSHDYPKNWPELLPSLISKFSNPLNLLGVLETLNSILKRFRYVERNDAIYIDLKYTLDLLQAPLLGLATSLNGVIEQNRGEILKCIRLVCRIFFSLNWLDLPEFFEDNVASWMGLFKSWLELTTSDEDEDEASEEEKVKKAVIENLNLYAGKDEECFTPFLGNFTEIIWKLLLEIKASPGRDDLCCTSLKFLTALISRSINASVFEKALDDIISKIVIPNVAIREADVEMFEDDPDEFILRDMEGGEGDSRRRCGVDLLRGMCRGWEDRVTAVVMGHVQSMIGKSWQEKDAAVLLLTAVAVRKESRLGGVSEVNPSVPVIDFFVQHVGNDLGGSEVMLLAGSLKFVSTFRNQFSGAQLNAIFPMMIGALKNSSAVVKTYAANGIEKVLARKADDFGKVQIQPHLEPLFSGLFSNIADPNLPPNAYVMKTIMRALATIKADAVPVAEMVIKALTDALAVVCKNPQNPHYNHYLFESLAVLIKSVCGSNPQYVDSFEPLLFPSFNHILQADVAEFTPYVFQILAQLLEYSNGVISESYMTLFGPLLTPVIWESKGNVPGVTRLVVAYIEKGGAKLMLEGGFLMPVLGVFQKLISSKANEHYGFLLMTSLIGSLGIQALQAQIAEVFNILFQRLQTGKTVRYQRHLTLFFAFVVGKEGAGVFRSILESIQPGMLGMILKGVWAPCVLTESMFNKSDSKTMTVGLTALLNDEGVMTFDGGATWSQTAVCVMKLLSTSVNASNTENKEDAKGDSEEVELNFDSSFSKLHHAGKPLVDKFPNVTDPAVGFAQALTKGCAKMPGVVQAIQAKCQDEKIVAAWEKEGASATEIMQVMTTRYGAKLA
ncbi:hypothetical protein TrLO_g11928 [Triparma laevis f. longispina]|uniref:Importin N-terminal domain-containing protein n=1 Tax=Triparma laevis f. longispina TaxID=1714387 RepID=A0A9W7FQP3_9STRA|nr:hypothetical protein TrLO_g11928 [Triparma laevis f. longispina]